MAELLPAEALLELEALHATFGEGAIWVRTAKGCGRAGASAEVVAALVPRDDALPFVAASLVLGIPQQYPAAGAEVDLEDVRGAWLSSPAATDALTAAATNRPPSQLPAGRPHCLAPVAFPAAAGLGDQRAAEILGHVRQEAAALAGDMQLGALVDLAISLLTEQNRPEGHCAFCLEAVGLEGVGLDHVGQITEHADNLAYAMMRLDCFHCFHM